MSLDFFPKGTLSIPSKTKLIYQPIALQHRLYRGAVIELAKGDTITKAQADALGFSIKAADKDSLITHGVRLRANKDLSILAEVSDNNKQAIALFKRKQNGLSSEMREAGKGIDVLFKNAKLICGTCELMQHEFRKTKRPLFQHKPCIQDIEQGSFGDCFLLASLIAVLRQPNGAEYIQGMMRQTENGTIVRLFHPKTLQPHYILVPNQVLYENGIKQPFHHAYWVHVIEQAYAIFAYKDENEQGISAFEDMYGSGGRPSIAVAIVTGQKAEVIYTTKNNAVKKIKQDLQSSHESIAQLMDLYNAIPTPSNSSDSSSEEANEFEIMVNQVEIMHKQTVEDSSSGSVLKKLDKLGNAVVAANWLKHANVLNAHESLAFQPDELDTPHDLLPLTRKMEEYPGIELLIGDVVADKASQLPGNSGTAIYTDEQIEFYANVAQAIAQGKMLTATTKFKEKQDNGLFSDHVYSIVGFEVDSKTRLNYLVLRNPWAKTGQELQLIDPKTQLEDLSFKATPAAEFKVELTKFCQRFACCTVSENLQVPQNTTPFQDNRAQLYCKLAAHRDKLHKELVTATFLDAYLKSRKIAGLNVLLPLLIKPGNENVSLSTIVNTVTQKNKLLTWGFFSRLDTMLNTHIKRENYMSDASSNLSGEYAKQHYHHFSPY